MEKPVLDVFEVMREEHKVIGEMLEVFSVLIHRLGEDAESVPVQDLENSLVFFKGYADKYHHGKEEDIIFPKADMQGIVTRQGGPKCTTFFGRFLENKHLQSVLEDVNAYDGEIIKYQPKESVEKLRAKNSPLAIPLEEHEFGYYSIQLMAAEIEKKKESKSWNGKFLGKVARRYVDMLRSHIAKEDQCLFVGLEKTFSTEMRTLAAEEFKSFNEKNEGIEKEALQILQNLKDQYI